MTLTLEERIRRHEDAKMLAIRMHGIQDYDGFPYQKHLTDVENELLDHGYEQDGTESEDPSQNKIKPRRHTDQTRRPHRQRQKRNQAQPLDDRRIRKRT